MKKIVVIFALVFGVQAWAEPVKMPSKSEINAAKDAVEALLESGTTAKEFLEMARESENGAERYLAYRCAFILQAEEGKYAEAAETLKAFRAEVTGVPASEIVSLIDKNVGKKFKESKELHVVYSDAKAKVTAERQIVKIKKEIKKNPKDPILKRSLAEATAISGDWPAALKEFEKADGEVADIVKAEKQGPNAKIAAFWWDYKPHKSFGATNAFKLHAASLYAGLLSKGGLSRFEETLAEKRVAAAEEQGAVVEESAGGDGKPKSELDKLKKICNTKGLVHCWRFNGDLKDCIGGRDAIIEGKSSISANYAINPEGKGNGIDLGPGIFPDNTNEITLEMWLAVDKKVDGKLFEFAGDKTHRFFLSNGSDGELLWVKHGNAHKNTSRPLDLISDGKEFHIAIILITEGGGSKAIVYKQDAESGKTILTKEVKYTSWNPSSFKIEKGWLGRDYYNSNTWGVRHNEFRIWNRALSEKELTQNAIKFHKAGETMKK